MKLYYNPYLNSYARKLRQGGNLSEVILWNQLKQNKLGYRFLRQRPIANYIVDFYCPLLKLIIEIDGLASHDNKMSQDAVRQKQLEDLGFKVVRFKDVDVRYNLEAVLESIKTEIIRLKAPLSVRDQQFPLY